MSRLIDADLLTDGKGVFSEYIKISNDFVAYIEIQDLIRVLDNIPTAFDTEKVVEQLEETKKTALNKVKMPIMIVCKHDLQEFADICFEEAIDIVKKGEEG